MNEQCETRASLLFHVATFADTLKKAGIAVDPSGVIDLCRGLEYIDIGESGQVHAAARATLVHRREDLTRFDELFREYWFGQRRPRSQRREDHEGDSHLSGQQAKLIREESDSGVDQHRDRQAGYSPDELIAGKDLSTLSEDEIERARHLVRKFISAFAMLRSRRHSSSSRGRLLDFRRMLRRTAIHGSDFPTLLYRRRKVRKLKLILLCDVSGSMEPYSRFLLEFIYALRRELPATEVAVFATRMTVISDLLETASVSGSLSEIAARAGDWGGGTDIGGCLRDFNDRFALELLRSDSVVVILSDGWDRGDAELMKEQIAKLKQRAHKIIWLNPLLGNTQYEPLTRGMRTALPHLDYFLPAHNLKSLARLARTLRTVWL